MCNTPVERKTLTKNLHTISQCSPMLCNVLCTTGETGKRTLHNLVENPPGIEISTGKSELEGESTTFMKGSQLVLYQILHYSIHASEENSKYKISVTTQISNSKVVI